MKRREESPSPSPVTDDTFADFADADEDEAAGDPPIDWDRLAEVKAIFDAAETPLDALKALYGDKLEVPA